MPISDPIKRMKLHVVEEKLDLWSFKSKSEFISISPKKPKGGLDYHVKDIVKRSLDLDLYVLVLESIDMV